jgi:hypothetical protein
MKAGKIMPDIDGGFRIQFAREFDSVFCVRAEPVYEGEGLNRQTVGSRHWLWTVTPPGGGPDVGDGIGGKGGRRVLPPRLENTWQALMEAWNPTTPA